MKSKKPDPINLPYASTVASYAQDQGTGPGGSFLGSLFKKGAVGTGGGTITRPFKQPGGGGTGGTGTYKGAGMLK